MAEGFNIKTIKLEGQLSKYTNVMRGYQFRYFVVNSELFRLDYFMSDDMKHQKPRGSIELKKAVISPSDEDSTTFTIHSFENEIFKLRAQDAKERQHWVNVLRYVVQSKGAENEMQIPVISLNRSNTSSTSSCNNNTTSNLNEILKTDAPLTIDNNNTKVAIPNEKISNLDLIREILNQVKLNHFKFEQLIENLPAKKGSISKYNKDILILKATGRSCVACITDCCNILKSNQKIKISNYIPAEQLNFLNKTKKSNKIPIQTNPRLLPALSLNNNNNKQLFHKSSNSLNDAITDAELTDPEDTELATSDNNNNTNSEQEHKNQLLQVILSDLKIGTDLTRVKLPLFLFEKRSLLELLADCLLLHADLFIKIDNIETNEDRFLAVLDWYLTIFHQISKLNKKPFNPMLGEKFQCSFKIKTDLQSDHLTVVKFLAEQVSHHPSVTAIFIECKEKRLKLNGSIRVKSEYLSNMSVSVQFVGELILKIDKYNEEYKLTLPTYYTRSIVIKPWSELGGICSVSCFSTGCSAIVDFILKSNQINVTVKNKNNDLICKINGEWNGKIEYEYYLNNNNKKTVIDINQLKRFKKRVRTIDKQEANESRRLWYHVSIALHKTDFQLASLNKNAIEKQFSQHEQNEFVSKYFNSHKKIITSNENNASSEFDQIIWINKNF